MKTETLIEKSGAYFLSQCQDRPEHRPPEGLCGIKPAITISHQAGAGAPEVADHLAKALAKTKCAGNQPWTVFNQQLIERALNNNRWPKYPSANIAEEKRFFLEELIDDVLDLQPPSWVLVPQVTKTILQLAQAGHVILIGHGATVVTANSSTVYHVRLTGSVSKRAERMQRLKNLTPAAAADFVKGEDRKRKHYLKAHFHTRLDNELLYDLVINTDRISLAAAGDLISEGAQRFYSER
jgi:cytidylate kinase